MTQISTHHPTSVLIAALGGEGGGVLADWLVQCARRSGLAVQATSVPGVAQRTGATSYYLEWLARPAGASAPVFALNPMPGRVDIVLSSEWLEAARMMERGFVTPSRTTLITSTHRVYTTLEKMHMADGRYDGDGIERAAQQLARRFVRFDMDAIATREGTVISAVMFGALAGAGALPWSREVCEQVISDSGKGVRASLAGFAAAFDQASIDSMPPARAAPAPTAAERALPRATWQAGVAELPPAMRETAAHGLLRCQDYQDERHAERYLQRLARLARAARDPVQHGAALDEAARQLALWMSYEDVIRVADLKSRRSRHERVRAEAQARPQEIVHVVEYFKPGIEEIAAILPARMGQWLTGVAQRRGWLGKAHVGLYIRSTRLWGHLLLRLLARLRPLRTRSLRYAQEEAAIEAWLQAMEQALGRSAAFALTLARLPTVLKGYGDTHARGRRNYAQLWHACVVPALQQPGALDEAAAALDQALQAALADPEGRQLAGTLGPAAASSDKPVIFLKPEPSPARTAGGP